MRAFLTGSEECEWRWNLADFLLKKQIDVVDPVTSLPKHDSTFRQLKILEGCDLFIVNLCGIQRQHLLLILEMSYASKLAKEVMIVDNIPQRTFLTCRFPSSRSFVDLNGLKAYLNRMLLAIQAHPRMFG